MHHGPSLWVGTNSGHIYPYTIELPPDDQRRSHSVQAYPKKPEIHLKHNAPVISMFVVDKDGNPVQEDLIESGQEKGEWRDLWLVLIICQTLVSHGNSSSLTRFRFPSHWINKR
jgi:lethal(2) giant larvae protein